MAKMLVCYYSRTKHTQHMAEAIADGARQVPGVTVDVKPVSKTQAKELLEYQGIILGSPTYFSDVTAEMKALIDRTGFVSKANGDMLRRKIGAAVIAVRRGGAIHAFDTINHFFLINQMLVPGSKYWNDGIGREIGEVNNDAEGVATMKLLGENIAWLLEKTSK